MIERIGDREGCEVVDASITLVIGSRQPRYQVLSRTELSISHGKGSALPGISFPLFYAWSAIAKLAYRSHRAALIIARENDPRSEQY